MESRSTRFFLGHFEHAIDGKSRLFVPSRFREKDDVFIMTQGLEQCLFLFPPQAWESLASKLDQLPLKDKTEERAFKRILLSGATEAAVDTQGRLLIPQMLRDYAGIRRDAIILGVHRHIEIWSKERWGKYHRDARKTFEKAARHLEL